MKASWRTLPVGVIRVAALLTAASTGACTAPAARPMAPDTASPGPSSSSMASAPSSDASAPADARPWAERRQAPAHLHRSGPAPGPSTLAPAPAGAEEVRYSAGGRELPAWFAVPEAASHRPVPALIYFHGAFSLDPDDFEHVRPFLDAGFAVLTPTLRGENGNPGALELLRGEVDDAEAATRWLAAQPGVDPQRIYALGHSVGGALAALLALVPNLPLRATASVGGIYVPETFVRWAKMKSQRHLVRFDAGDPRETELRVLGPQVCELARPHLAIYGREDRWFADNVAAVSAAAAPCGAPFTALEVPGDHMRSLDAGVEAWLARLRGDAG